MNIFRIVLSIIATFYIILAGFSLLLNNTSLSVYVTAVICSVIVGCSVTIVQVLKKKL